MRRQSSEQGIPSSDRVREILAYNPVSGIFTWRVSPSNRSPVGSQAGSLLPAGYRYIKIDGHVHSAARIVWLYVHREWPQYQITHLNGDNADDRIANLALMTGKGNVQLTKERILEFVSYDPETGIFTWIKTTSNRAKIGEEAGSIPANGYRYLSIDGTKFLAHRLAWYLVYDEWPEEMIDHINCDRLDNRIVNLRKASSRENTRNSRPPRTNTSGYKGVSFHRSSNKWVARIVADYRIYVLGKFKTKEEAHAAYCEASQRLHGEFSRTS